MTDMLETKKYTFTVEGETERWYLLWLRDRINEQEGKEYKVAIEPKVQQHPMKFAKGVNAISTPEVIHINVDHQLLKIADVGYYVETPKTKSGNRVIPMSEKVLEAFQRVLNKRKYVQPVILEGYTKFLFLNRNGLPKVAVNYESMFRGLVRKYNKTQKVALPKVMTPHTLRHTFCTTLANAGMNPKALQYIMGHSNINMTLNYYAHTTSETSITEMKRLIA